MVEVGLLVQVTVGHPERPLMRLTAFEDTVMLPLVSSQFSPAFSLFSRSPRLWSLPFRLFLSGLDDGTTETEDGFERLTNLDQASRTDNSVYHLLDRFIQLESKYE